MQCLFPVTSGEIQVIGFRISYAKIAQSVDKVPFLLVEYIRVVDDPPDVEVGIVAGVFQLPDGLAAAGREADGYADIALAVEGMKRGAFDFIVKPWDNEKLIEVLTAARDKARKAMKRDARSEAATTAESPMFWGSSSAMKSIRKTLDKIAPTDATVLITGENGTGKDVLAREIHARSLRSGKPMVALYSWMRSVIFLCICRRSCFVLFRTGVSYGWAAMWRSPSARRWICGS